jgi:hypothetical protein
VADARFIAFVELAPDACSDDCTERGSGNDGDRASGSVADLRPDDAADCSTGNAEDHIGLAASGDHAIVLRPRLAGVAHIGGIVLLAPAVRLGMRRRIRQNGSDDYQRDDGSQAGEGRHGRSGNEVLNAITAPPRPG